MCWVKLTAGEQTEWVSGTRTELKSENQDYFENKVPKQIPRAIPETLG